MDPDVADLARRAAARLSDRFGERLPAQVEAGLHDGTAGRQYVNAVDVSLAALVISIAQFLWNVCKDSHKTKPPQPPQPPPNPEVLIRRVRLEVDLPADVTTAQRDAIAAAVVAELTPLLTTTKPEPRDGEPPDR
jgi:hypothetical protein